MKRHLRPKDEFKGKLEVFKLDGGQRVPVKPPGHCVLCGEEIEDGHVVVAVSEEWVWMDGRKVPLGLPRHRDCDEALPLVQRAVLVAALRAI